MRYLLDTNILSDLVRNPQGRTAKHVHKVGDANVCTSILVAAELRFGAAKKASARLQKQVQDVLGALEVLPWKAPADAVYGSIRAQLELAGNTIGANDLLIAAHTISLGHILVTDNEREFGRVSGLSLQNWLRSGHELQ